MQTPVTHKPRLKVRANTKNAGLFELKGSGGLSLGFVMNGDGKGPSFVIAGAGPAVRNVFQKVLMWPATKVIHGRLALIMLDKIVEDDASTVLGEITNLLSPVQDSLFLPSLETKHPESDQASIQTIENFCAKHGLFSVKATGLDCASL